MVQVVFGLGMVSLIHTVGAQGVLDVCASYGNTGCIHQFVMKDVKTSLRGWFHLAFF